MEWLNYHHLLYFRAVAHEGSVRGAAQALSVSQPSVSAQVTALEQALGEKLFQRAGRGKALTETGRMVLGYADEIFSLGQELLGSVQGRGGPVLRLQVGVVDSFPKLVANRILEPIFAMTKPVRMICREGKLEDLLAQLAVHRLEVVLADASASGHSLIRTFSHPLGDSGVTICAAPALARSLRRGFPRSLHEAPALLPAAPSALREALQKWFDGIGVRPRVLAEFEDLALMKALAADGKGFIAVPSVIASEAVDRYGFRVVGENQKCRVAFFAITAERRVQHPAVALITEAASRALRG